MWATANLQQTWEPRGQEISLQRKRQELTDLESDTTLWPPHYFSLDPARPYSHLPLCSPNRTQKNHSKKQHGKWSGAAGTCIHLLQSYIIYVFYIDHCLTWIYSVSLWGLCPSVLWVLDLQASLIATILSNGSTAESIVKASWEATRAARHNSSVACSHPIPLVLGTPHSMVAILRKSPNYKTMVSGCFWEVSNNFNNRGKGLFPWHVAHLAN